MSGTYYLKLFQSFSSAHFLRDYQGPCARMHGHDYKVEVEVAANCLQSNGLAIDSSDIKRALQELVGQLDHRCLNELAPFTEINPSAENIAAWFYQNLQRQFERWQSVWVESVIIHETEKFSVRYTERKSH